MGSHHQVPVRRPHGLQEHQVAGHRHAGVAGPAHRREVHPRDAVHHRAGPLESRRRVHVRRERAVRVQLGRAAAVVREHLPPLQEQAAVRHGQQDGRGGQGGPGPGQAEDVRGTGGEGRS